MFGPTTIVYPSASFEKQVIIDEIAELLGAFPKPQRPNFSFTPMDIKALPVSDAASDKLFTISVQKFGTHEDHEFLDAIQMATSQQYTSEIEICADFNLPETHTYLAHLTVLIAQSLGGFINLGGMNSKLSGPFIVKNRDVPTYLTLEKLNGFRSIVSIAFEDGRTQETCLVDSDFLREFTKTLNFSLF